MKQIDDFVREMSVKLPPKYYRYRQTFKVTMQDINNYGLGICPYEYELDISIKKDVNHKRRLVRAYRANGVDGMRAYVKRVFRK